MREVDHVGEKVKLFSGCTVDVEKEINSWLNEHQAKLEVTRIAQSSGSDHRWLTLTVFYKEKSSTKTEAPPEIRINRNA